jgi:tight adherence protein B
MLNEDTIGTILVLLREHRQTILLAFMVLAFAGTGIGYWLSRHLRLKARIRHVVKAAGQNRQAGGRGANDLSAIEKRLRSAERQKGDKEKAKRTIDDRLAEAGLALTVQQFWQLAAGLGMAGVALALILQPTKPLLAVAFATTFGLGLPMLVLSTLAKRRKKQFLSTLPDALEVMVRGLKAGLPVNEALAMIGREFKGPIAKEFAIVTDEQAAGFSLAEALERCAHRMPMQEMHMLAIAISIQAQTGGSLSETLQNLSDVIRARFKLKRKVQAMTSEAKASAGIIGSLPFLLSSAIAAIAPDYMLPMWDTRLGNLMIAGALCWLTIGILVMAKMIHFRV